MSRHVTCIPSSDETFQTDASAALAKIHDGRLDDVADRLSDLLRPTYPAVVVRRQAVLARLMDKDVWYAYRDGSAHFGRELDSPERDQ
jgi:hypothetical protein